MDYEKKYKEALGWMQSVYPTMTGADKEDAEHVFPELAESEDERIRKAIINTIEDCSPILSPEVQKRMIAWLEKQGEQKSIFDFNANNWCVSKVDGKIHNIYNVGVEPKFHESKFHEGDWIVSNDKKSTYQVIEIKRGIYVIRDIVDNHEYHIGIEECEKSGRLWNIADAKDGDVLSDGTTIFIFKDLLSDGSVMSYCDYDTDSGESDAFCPLSMNLMCSRITPATKEQRDLLFQKMKESGYTFDFEKKELKKIEDEEYNGEDYGIDSLFHAQRILEKTLGKVDGYQTDDGILSHKCAITAVKKLYEQNPKWTEDDNLMIDSIIDTIERLEGKGATSMKDWLESLKQRMEE